MYSSKQVKEDSESMQLITNARIHRMPFIHIHEYIKWEIAEFIHD